MSIRGKTSEPEFFGCTFYGTALERGPQDVVVSQTGNDSIGGARVLYLLSLAGAPMRVIELLGKATEILFHDRFPRGFAWMHGNEMAARLEGRTRIHQA